MKQEKLDIWNSLDEFGLMVGLGHWTDDGRELKYVRYPGETNSQLKERILQTYKHKANATYQGLINGISRDLLTTEYNVIDQYIYPLSFTPYPQSSGIKVFVSGVSWTEYGPQVRASGYLTASSGWIVWNEADYVNADNSITYGNYVPILEFISLPDNNTPIRIEYEILDHYEDDGKPVLIWYTDIDKSNIKDPDEYQYRIKKAETPNNSNQIVIHRLNNLKTSAYSGVFYTNEGAATSKLKEVANYLNKKHPIEWGKIPWDTTSWDNTVNLSQGTLPTLFDAELPNHSGILTSGCFIGGVKNGPNLYMMDIVKEERDGRSGAYAYWHPIVYPGTFYISNTGYYLFENKQNTFHKLVSNTGILSGTILPDYGDQIIVGVSGYTGTTGSYMCELYRYPYGSGYNFKSDNIYRRTNKFVSNLQSHTYSGGEYYIDIDNNILSGVSLNDQIIMIWEHPKASGVGKIISGIDLNVYMNNIDSSILFLG